MWNKNREKHKKIKFNKIDIYNNWKKFTKIGKNFQKVLQKYYTDIIIKIGNNFQFLLILKQEDEKGG